MEISSYKVKKLASAYCVLAGCVTLLVFFLLGEKPFECNECGRRFARSTDLKVHMPVHSEDKPYKCGECEKMFTRFSTLKEHIRTHTGNRLRKVSYFSLIFARRAFGEAASN